MDGLWESFIITGRVLRDKIWYGFWNFDLHKKVKRIYPKETYYQSLSDLLASQPSHIIDNIYVGNAFNAANYRLLKEYNIKTIVNATPSISNYFPDEFNYYNCKVVDLNDSSLGNYYKQFYEIVKDSDNVFVHCFAGKSRSAVLVLYYMMREYGWSLERSLEMLKVKRPCININTTFIEELKEMFPNVEYF
jgi:protein-tyrosine phosphatase